jgi:aminoglycoside phosphotransferase (APT) family kinase protein
VEGTGSPPLIAQGRDADIFDAGPGKVLRRARDGRSIAAEAEVMGYLGSHGYPLPDVFDVSDDGSAITMERIEGPSMLAYLQAKPWQLRRLAGTLAELHDHLHDITSPGEMRPAPAGAPGDRVLHLDLHPLNVIMSPRGPVVIDWTNACQGDPLVDVALTWLLLGAGQAPGSAPARLLVARFREGFLRSFLSSFDRADVAARLSAVVDWKAHDPNMSPAEVAVMRSIARNGTAAPPSP